MMWLGLLALLAVMSALQLMVLGAMMPLRIVARARVGVPGRSVDVRPDAERAASEAVSCERGGAATPEVTIQTQEHEGETRVMFTVAGEVPGRLARLYAHFIRFPMLARACAARLRHGPSRSA